MLPPCRLYSVISTFSTYGHILIYREDRKEKLLYFFKPDKGQIIRILICPLSHLPFCLLFKPIHHKNGTLC